MPKEFVDIQMVDKKTGRVVWEGKSIKLGEDRYSINKPHEHIPDGYVYPIGYIETAEGITFTESAILEGTITFPIEEDNQI